MPSRPIESPNQPLDAPESAQARSRPWFLLGLIVVYLLLAISYNKLVPFENGAAAAAAIQRHQLPVNPDEAAHVANGYVYKAGHIPVFQAGSPDFEAHQPPLYYALIAPMLMPQESGAGEPASGARWLSILIGAALIGFVWLAAREIFPDNWIMADTMACICLLPTNVNVCASISNDVLTNAVVAATVWQLARVIRLAGESRAIVTQSLILGCVMAAGIYTKTSTLVLFPAVIVAGWLLARQGITSGRVAVQIVGISCLTALALASPWLIRNTRLYGDPLAQHIFNAAFSGTTATMTQMLTHVPPSFYVTWVASWTFASFWAVFDGMRLFLPNSIYYLLAALMIAQCIGAGRWMRRTTLAPYQGVALASIATVALMTLLAFARFNTAFFQAQGRYLYPGLEFFGFVLAAGTLGWMRRSGSKEQSFVCRWLPYATAIALLILNGLSIYTLHYAFPSVG